MNVDTPELRMTVIASDLDGLEAKKHVYGEARGALTPRRPAIDDPHAGYSLRPIESAAPEE